MAVITTELCQSPKRNQNPRRTTCTPSCLETSQQPGNKVSLTEICLPFPNHLFRSDRRWGGGWGWVGGGGRQWGRGRGNRLRSKPRHRFHYKIMRCVLYDGAPFLLWCGRKWGPEGGWNRNHTLYTHSINTRGVDAIMRTRSVRSYWFVTGGCVHLSGPLRMGTMDVMHVIRVVSCTSALLTDDNLT